MVLNRSLNWLDTTLNEQQLCHYLSRTKSTKQIKKCEKQPYYFSYNNYFGFLHCESSQPVNQDALIQLKFENLFTLLASAIFVDLLRRGVKCVSLSQNVTYGEIIVFLRTVFLHCTFLLL